MDTLIIKPTCANCKYGALDPGTTGTYEDPPEPGGWYCTFDGYDPDDEAITDIMNAALEDATKCPEFVEKVVDLCYKCQKKIEGNQRGWPFTYIHWYSGEPYFACSQECVDMLSAQGDQDVKEMLGPPDYVVAIFEEDLFEEQKRELIERGLLNEDGTPTDLYLSQSDLAYDISRERKRHG